MKTILFITTSADKMSDNQTGIWFEELSTPYYILHDAGFDIEFASPKGGKPPFDPRAFEHDAITPSVKRFLDDKIAVENVENSKLLSTVNLSIYDAIFFPGGHGAVVDLPRDKFLAEHLGRFFESGKPVAAICHGPGGLVAAKKSNGRSIVDGKKVCSFTNSEEVMIGVEKIVPFLLETRLKELGGIFVCGSNFSEFAIQDGNLITAQNPQSSRLCGELLRDALKNR